MPSNRRRNSIESAVVLKSARLGEIHRSVTLLIPRRGVVYATAHGAGKAASKLKAAAIPFAYVTAYLYHDPVRDSFKVTDVEPLDLHGTIRADLTKFFTASLWVEVVLRSHGGGTEATALHALLVTGLRTLDAAAATQTGAVSVQVAVALPAAPGAGSGPGVLRRLRARRGSRGGVVSGAEWRRTVPVLCLRPRCRPGCGKAASRPRGTPVSRDHLGSAAGSGPAAVVCRG